MMASNAVPKSITTNTNIVVHHEVLNVEELMKHQKYHATFCVYRVPKSLSSTKPEAFTPQFVGLGPYNHRLPQLCFDYLKVSAVTSVLNNSNVLTKVVQELSNSNLAPLIRRCYDTSLVFKDDTLLYLMTIDALFLYYLLSCISSFVIVIEEESHGTVVKFDLQVSIFAAQHRMPLVNSNGVELTNEAIIRDVFMLENQIPILILEKIMRVVISMETEEKHPQYEDVGSKMLDFCRAFCPFVYLDEQLPIQSEVVAVKYFHLLDLMYHLMMPAPNQTLDEHEPNFNPNPDENAEQGGSSLKKLYRSIFNFLVQRTTPNGQPLLQGGGHCYDGIWNIIMRLILILTLPLVCLVSPLVYLYGSLGRLIVFLLGLSYPAVKMVHDLLTSASLPFMQPITTLVGIVERICGLSLNLVMDVEIPSVTELHKAGIHFHPAYGVISSSGQGKEFTFYLPKIKVDVNSEVLMRNLVAYESLTKSYCLYFTRYVELMRSLIKTAEDVKLLVDKKIIQTKFSDAQVAQLFDEISKSIIRPTNTPQLDGIIKEVINEFHRVNRRKFQNMCVYIGQAIVIFVYFGLLILFFDIANYLSCIHIPDMQQKYCHFNSFSIAFFKDLIAMAWDYITSSVIKVFDWFGFS